jgi:hypothetical protein
MAFARIVAFALAASVLTWASAEAAGPLRPFNLGYWSGGAYTDDRTGAFTHCSAGVAYDSGINVFVLITGDHHWWLGFVDPQWAWSPMQKLKVELRLDKRAPFARLATVPSGQLLLVPLPQDSQLIAALRHVSQLTLIAQGEWFRFKLDDASAVLDKLTSCVRRSVELATRAGPRPLPKMASTGLEARPQQLDSANLSQISPAGAPSPGASVTMPPVSAPGPQASWEPPASSALAVAQTPAVAATSLPAPPQDVVAPTKPAALEEIRLAQDFFTFARLPNARIAIADKPAALASFSAVWRSDDAAGAVKILPSGPDVSAIGIASNLIAVDPRLCSGNFTTARSRSTIDGSVVFSAVLSCTEANEQRTARYFVTPRRQGGFVVFAVVDSIPAMDGKGGADQRMVDLFAKAAVRAAADDG